MVALAETGLGSPLPVLGRLVLELSTQWRWVAERKQNIYEDLGFNLPFLQRSWQLVW